MPYPSPNDTICAIATPPGPGGLGVVRLSGPSSREILARLWRGSTPVASFEPRRLYLGEIGDGNNTPHLPLSPEGRGRSVPPFPLPAGERPALSAVEGVMVRGIDRVMAVVMPGPATYTSDDVVEISAHGAPILLQRIVNACISCGARPAEPGEFTKRAFLAGKLDLAQAEAVADLIAATSERAARIAADQLAGRLSREVTAIADAIADLRAAVEVSIDFPEEDIESIEYAGISKRLTAIVEKVSSLAQSFREGRLIRDGVRTAIVGRPNAGKSSVFNRLAGCERTIVHHSPGTTRDVVEESVTFGGIAFHLRDTAGMRQSACEIEGLGVQRSREEIRAADLVIAIFDGSVPFGHEDEEVLRSIDPPRSILVINKADLPQAFDLTAVGNHFRGSTLLVLSAKTGAGFERLQDELVARISNERDREGVKVTSSRHKAALDEALSALSEATRAIESKRPMECIASHLRDAQDSLGKITGSVSDEDLLDRIFQHFCIGK